MYAAAPIVRTSMPMGAARVALPLNEVGALEVQIVPRSGRTPYAWWGDRAALVVCLFALLAAFQFQGRAMGHRYFIAEDFR